jgi:signal transduction histidine kinase
MTEDHERSADRAAAGRLLALGVLVPGVVHELNNALLGLLGMLELAQMDAAPAVGERISVAQQAGEEIREIARVLGALAREPLDGEEPVVVQEVAHEAVEVAGTLNVVRGLELIEVSSAGPVSVRANRAQLRQAVILLLAAAFAGSGREGSLLVEVDEADGDARVAVRHSGAGELAGDDPALAHVDTYARARNGSLGIERTRVILTLPVGG